MGKSVTMSNFSPENFKSIVPVWLENVIVLLMNILPAFVIKVSHIDCILTFQKALCLLPMVHRPNKHSLELLYSMIEPDDVS